MLWQTEGRIPNIETRVREGRELGFTSWYRGALALMLPRLSYLYRQGGSGDGSTRGSWIERGLEAMSRRWNSLLREGVSLSLLSLCLNAGSLLNTRSKKYKVVAGYEPDAGNWDWERPHTANKRIGRAGKAEEHKINRERDDWASFGFS